MFSKNSKKRLFDAHSSRGVGQGSRLDFDNESLENKGWIVEKKAKGFKWTSPKEQGSKVFYSSNQVQSFLTQMESMSSDESDDNFIPSSDDCLSSPEKIVNGGWSGNKQTPLPMKYYIGMTDQLQHFLDQVNATRTCSITKGCKGKLIPVAFQDKGLGGAIKVTVACSECTTDNKIHFASSKMALTHNRRNCVSLATALCFLVYGQGYHTYHKVLKLGLGINTLASSNFSRVIEICHPHAKSILDDMCVKAKEHMKAKKSTEIGSWERAVTSSDGCWLIRGFHSQCCSFVIIDFLSSGILYYGHLCMRGSDNISDTELWQGTSKAAEGHLAYELFKIAKEEGLNVEINWQDQDSTAEISFREVFPDGELNRVMLCGGHIGRSHGNNLKEYKTKKVLDKGFIDKYKKVFPKIANVKCCCEGKKHSKTCGCMSDEFIAASKRNHFSALKQSGNDPEEYARRMKVLGKYHSRNIHTWENDDGKKEECEFHPLIVCSCGECPKVREMSQGDVGDEDDVEESSSHHGIHEVGSSVDDCQSSSADEDFDEDFESDVGEGDIGGSDEDTDSECSDDEVTLKCAGKQYSTRHALTCELHSLLYEIECHRIASKAKDIVHTEMGRGHSNLPESKFNVLTRFRTKNVNLHKLHYEFITNIGLCQSNMTFMYKAAGASYHWMRELYCTMSLPIPDGLEEIWKQENQIRMKGLTRQKSAQKLSKLSRVKNKQKRLQESKQRKMFVKRQKILHNYGSVDDELQEEEVLAEVERRINHSTHTQPQIGLEAVEPPPGAEVTVGRSRCKCGSYEHQRTSHKSCRFNKKNKQKELEQQD